MRMRITESESRRPARGYSMSQGYAVFAVVKLATAVPWPVVTNYALRLFAIGKKGVGCGFSFLRLLNARIVIDTSNGAKKDLFSQKNVADTQRPVKSINGAHLCTSGEKRQARNECTVTEASAYFSSHLHTIYCLAFPSARCHTDRLWICEVLILVLYTTLGRPPFRFKLGIGFQSASGVQCHSYPFRRSLEFWLLRLFKPCWLVMFSSYLSHLTIIRNTNNYWTIATWEEPLRGKFYIALEIANTIDGLKFANYLT